MILDRTPVEDHREAYGLLVKREDLCCPPPGPPFSKARGVYAHVAARPEKVIGVLDTHHSQGGHAVALACKLVGKDAVVFYPSFRRENDVLRPREPQLAARRLGAALHPLPAGRSAVLYHGAKKSLRDYAQEAYMMPNALKLPESVEETAKEVQRTYDDCSPKLRATLDSVRTVLVSASSATIASGVLRGLGRLGWGGTLVVHLGYHRSHDATRKYVWEFCRDFSYGTSPVDLVLVDEGYAYADVARPGETPPWPCNEHYDLKAFRWWVREGRARHGEALLWNIG